MNKNLKLKETPGEGCEKTSRREWSTYGFPKIPFLNNKRGKLFEIIWAVGEKGLKFLTTLIGSIIIANYLGRDLYGLFGYVVALSGLFVSIPFLGVKNYLARDLAEKKITEEVGVSTSLFTTFFGIISTILIINIVSILINGGDHKVIYLCFVGSLYYIFIWCQVFEPYFIYKSKVKLYSIYRSISSVVSLCMKLLGIYFDLSLDYFVWVFALESLPLILLITYWNYKNKLISLKAKYIDLTYAKSIVKKSLPLILSGLGVSIYMQIDQVMITNLLGSDSNGYYALANKLSSSIHFIPVAICNTLIPSLAFAKTKGEDFFERKIKLLFGGLFWMGLLSCAIIFLIIPFVVKGFFSSEFLNTISIAQIYIWSTVFVFIMVGHDKWLIQERKYYILMEKSLMGAGLNIILNIVLIPKFNLIGAAFATLIAYSFCGYLYYLIRAEVRKVFFLQSYSILFVIRDFKKLWKS